MSLVDRLFGLSGGIRNLLGATLAQVHLIRTETATSGCGTH